MTPDTSILISGGGPVGLTVAVKLMRRGFQPVIIDDDGEPTPESRALAVNARTLDILEPSGVTERIIAEGTRINGMIFLKDAKETMRLEMRYLPHRFNFMVSLPQSRTEELLIDRLGELGCTVNWFTELRQFEQNENGIQCELQSKAGTKEHASQLLIGADGAHSLVRKSLGLSFDGETEPQAFSLADVTLDDWPFPFDHGVIHAEADRIVGFIPISEGHGRFVSNYPDLLNHLPPSAKVKDVIWESAFKISYRQVETYQSGRTFLAGDAAHIHSPVGGRGMNLGIEDAATLAWLMEQGKTDDYTAMRHPIGAQVLKFTQTQTEQLTQRGAFQRFLQNTVAPLLLKVPAIQRLAVSRIAGLETPHPPWL
ncbi:MAG: FAD-dependent monooxygenase [Alphaproteobacteria bacterium]|nr:FAD-dependent monooxygenase [Alphaproteobacteria bacterium]